MNYSLKQIINSRSEQKKNIDKLDIWVFIVVRPISNLLTWFFLKMKITANTATGLSTIIGAMGTVLLIIPNKKYTLLGLIFINMWIFFDCVDGNIARTTKMSSKTGEFFDGISGYTFLAFLYIGIGVNVYNFYPLTFNGEDMSWMYMLIGSVASMACILPRLMDNKAKTMFVDYDSKITNKDDYSLVYKLGLNVAGVAGLSNPLMIIAFFTGTLNFYLIIYFFIQSGIGLLAIYKTIASVSKLNN
ncbi:hypothetical protein LABALGNA3A7_05790 [Dellaglioa algida]|nr:hypothetical protein LABALGNA3A7_05790 [Dellaglioa algida]